MSQSLTTALLTAALAAPALAQEKDKGPASPPPTLHVVSRVDADKGEVWVTQIIMVPATEKRVVVVKVLVNGKEVPENRETTVTVTRHETREVLWSAKGGRAVDGAGEPIKADELGKRVKAGDTVLVGTGDRVDPAWLKVLKPEAVILL